MSIIACETCAIWIITIQFKSEPKNSSLFHDSTISQTNIFPATEFYWLRALPFAGQRSKLLFLNASKSNKYNPN